MSNPAIKCPHCDSRSEIRSSRAMSLTVRDIYYACTEVTCGHTWVAQLSIVRTLSQPACPRPSVRIPFIPERHRPPHPANDPLPEIAAQAAGG